MKIASARSWIADLGNTKPYTIAYKTVDSVRNVFVEIVLENRIAGLGSANPSKQVVGEDVEDCAAHLGDEAMAFMDGRDIENLDELLGETGRRFHKKPGSCAAIDIALYDAFSQHRGVPLLEYLGQRSGPLQTSVTIGIKGVDETIREAEEYQRQGFHILKVKTGSNLDEDIERLVKLREKFGSGITIRVDVNQGYDVPRTLDFFRRTEKLDIELVEQPLPAAAVDDLRQLPNDYRDRIAADESLLSAADARVLGQEPRCAGIYNIKLMKCGGISAALEIAGVALGANVDLFWGCNDESIVSITAALHAAYACPHTKYIDLDGSLDLASDIVTGGFTIANGLMRPLDAPGLGLKRL